MSRQTRRPSSRWILTAGVLLAGCGNPDTTDEQTAGQEEQAGIDAPSLTVYTVNYPLAYFAERIGGDAVEVVFPTPPGTDPAFWSPDPESVAAFQSADLILLNGAGYAGWTAKVSLPASKVVNTSGSFEDRYVVEEDAVVHTHGPEGEHEHQNTAFTTWLDPTLALEHARAIKDAMTEARPAAQAAFQAGFEALEADLLDLDRRMESAFASLGGEPIMGSHPVYQYLARRYGLNMRSVHFEPHEVPGASAWRSLAELAARHPARVMLWEAPPRAETESRLQESYGMLSVVFDPVSNRPEEGDYMSVMTGNADRVIALP